MVPYGVLGWYHPVACTNIMGHAAVPGVNPNVLLCSCGSVVSVHGRLQSYMAVEFAAKQATGASVCALLGRMLLQLHGAAFGSCQADRKSFGL